LDKKCAEVDEMIALQEQIIEELKAYKQSVISEAVTKGLNPAASMRDSGIEWIGEIPEHWEVCRVKNVASLFGRIGFRGYTSDDLNKDGEGAITLSPSNMLPMGMDYTNVTYLSWMKYHESPEIMIQNGDILMVKTGSSYGKVSYVDNLPKEATINPQILRIVSRINPKYLGYYLQTPLFIYQVEGGVVGGTIPTISQEKINNFFVAMPSTEEQQTIADYLDEKCADIDNLIQTKQSKIDSLKEYKKSIIYEYVTGKKEAE
jgi:type I restriction enzyme S subunit